MNAQRKFLTGLTVFLQIASLGLLYNNAQAGINTAPLQLQISSYTLADVTLPNSILQPGHAANLTVTLKALNQAANSVNATLSSADACVTIQQNGAGFGNILAGTSQNNAVAPFEFTVSSACQNNHVINFTLNLNANNGAYIQNIPLSIPVGGLYVATTGNDSTGNGSFTKPYATLQHAVMFLQPGNTLNVEAGSYVGFVVGWDAQPALSTNDAYGLIAGTATAPITIQADPNLPVGSVIINQKNNKSYAGVDLEPGADYITIQGFNVTYTGACGATANIGSGIKSSGGLEGNTDDTFHANIGDKILNNTISGTCNFGILTGETQNVLIQGNIVHDIISGNGGGTEGHCVYVSNSAINPVVNNNVMYNCANLGLHTNGDLSQCPTNPASPLCPGYTNNALIENNIIYNTGGNGIDGDGLVNSTIENNLIFDGHDHGITLFYSDAVAPSSHDVVVNNTIYNPSGTSALRLSHSTNNITLYNNILVGGGSSPAIDVNVNSLSTIQSDLSTIKSDYNLIAEGGSVIFEDMDANTLSNTQGFAQWQSYGEDAHSKPFTSSSAVFANASGTLSLPSDFQLLSTSPAINAGTATDMPGTDILGAGRNAALGYDIGAFEYNGTIVPPVTYTLNASAGSNGSITPSGTVMVNQGSSQMFTLTPASGYTASLTVDGVAVTLTNNTYTITNVTSNHTLSAGFAPLPAFTLTVSAGSNGSISPSGSVSVASGGSQTFTLTPNSGYTASLTVDGTAVNLSNNSYTLSNVTANHTVTAGFIAVPVSYTITASAGSNGSIAPSGSVTVAPGASQTFTLTPNSGYTASLTVDGTAVTLTNNTYTLSSVKANHTLSASFTVSGGGSNGKTYYVATNGNDGNSGLSITTAFKTIQNAVMHLQPGDTLNIEPGNYTGWIIGWDPWPAFSSNDPYGIVAGTASAPITIQADPNLPGGSVIINARDNKTPAGIDLEPGCDYVIIKGITVGPNSTIQNDGIKITSSHDQLINNTIKGVINGFGIMADNADYAVIQGNTITATGGSGNYGHGLYVSGTSTGTIVNGNIIYANANLGIHMNADQSECPGGSASSTCSGLITNATVENNMIYNNGSASNPGVGINAEGVQNSLIANNLIFGNSRHGITFYQTDSAGPSKNNIIVNNTIYQPNSNGAAIQITNQSTGNIFYNNIFIGGSQGSISVEASSMTGMISDHNVLSNAIFVDTSNSDNWDNGSMTLAQWQGSYGMDKHSIQATASQLFTNASGNLSLTTDYELSSTSPAMNAGTTTDLPAVDILGNARTSADIGAYEHSGTLPLPTTYTITVSAGSNGSINPSGSVTVNAGASQTFTLTPNSGYSASLTVDGSAVSLTNNAYTLSNVNANHTVAASFTAIPVNYTLTVSAGSNGTISPAGTVTVVSGGSQTFTVTANSGYTANLTVDGTAVALSNGTYTLSNVTANHAVAASFTAIPPITYTLTVNATNGTVTQSVNGKASANPYAAGTVVTLTAVPAAGYQLSGWSIALSGSAVAKSSALSVTNPMTITMNANETVTANFTLIPPATYTITASAGTGGTISPSGAVTVNSGATQAFSITPNSGYQIADVLVNGSSVGPVSTFPFNNVTANATISASFAPIVSTKTYTLTVKASHGSVSQSVNGTASSGPYNAGTAVTLTAVPASGYQFSSWSGAVTGTSNQATVTMSTNRTVTANFKKSPISVSLSTTLHNPANNTLGSVDMTAAASEVNGTITKVEFYRGGSILLGTVTSAPYKFTWTNVSAGNHYLTARAYDANGSVRASATVIITASGLPVVNLRSPAVHKANGVTTVTLTAGTYEVDGAITEVDFYNGKTKLGKGIVNASNARLYQLVWNNAAAGSYSLTAVAMDKNGNSTTSKVVALTIK